MLIYIGILLFNIGILVGSRFLPKNKKFLILELALFILPMIFVSSFKGISVGADTIQYKNFYDASLTSISNTEVGYMLINRLFKSTGLPFFGYLLIMYTLIYSSVAFFCYKKSNNSLLLLFFIMYFGFFGFSISGIRQSFAIAILLFGFSFFEYKKPISLIAPIIALVLALFIHRTSFFVMVVPLLLIFTFKEHAFIYTVLVAVTIGVIAPFIYSLVVLNIESYLLPSINNTYWTLFIYGLFGLLTFLLINKKTSSFISKKLDKYGDKTIVSRLAFNETNEDTEYAFSYATVLACIIYPFFILLIGNYNPVFSRVNYYLLPFTGLFLIALINNKKLPLFSRDLLNGLLILFVSLYFIYSVLIKNPLGVVPFSFGPIM